MPVQEAARGAFGAILALALTLSACSSTPSRTAGQGTISPPPGGSSAASCASRLTGKVKNTGQALHNISVTAQTIDSDVQAGQSVTVTVKVPGGTVPFVCKYHTGAGMQGAFTSA